MNIGAAIKQLRLAKKLTQEELAEHANTSKPNISNLERNAQGFSPVILTSLAKALGVKVSDIFRLAEEIDEPAETDSGDTLGVPDEVGDGFDELRALYETLTSKRRAALVRFLKTWTNVEE